MAALALRFPPASASGRRGLAARRHHFPICAECCRPAGPAVQPGAATLIPAAPSCAKLRLAAPSCAKLRPPRLSRDPPGGTREKEDKPTQLVGLWRGAGSEASKVRTGPLLADRKRAHTGRATTAAHRRTAEGWSVAGASHGEKNAPVGQWMGEGCVLCCGLAAASGCLPLPP